MAYTALQQMKSRNEKAFGKGVGPIQPERHYDSVDHGLKAMALRFLHARCEGLGFDVDETDGAFHGTSLLPGQIPYNMQMDLNRLCLERELEKFIDSGAVEDAYTVYYCYLEMFFGHYGKSKKMVELLSEFESNGSSLLMKHRDHYSHSVYVFALGLAIYESNYAYRAAFKKFYGFEPGEANTEADHAAACCFLEYWGLTSLFHDIGYPFELPFEQVLSYYEVAGGKRGEGSLYLAYRDVDAITRLGVAAKEQFLKLYGRPFRSTEELFAFGVTKKLGAAYDFTEDYMLGKIHDKPIAPNTFNYFMDHAYFSATRLYREIENSIGIEKINEKHVDALTAILLHNSLFKFAVSFFNGKNYKRPLRMDEHERWIREHISMGWISGDVYETASLPEELLNRYGDEKTARKALREQLRMHKLAMDGNPKEAEIFAHYAALPLEEREKDYEPFNSMLKLIKKFDGLRIYKLD